MKSRSILFLFALVAPFVVGCSGSKSGGAGTRIRVLTYNIHHGEGLDGKVDLNRIADVIRDARVDLVALQEVDRGVERTKKIDMMTTLSDLTGMTYAFGKNIDYQGGDYGNGILTKFPILEEKNLHYTMIRAGEQRGLMRLLLDVRGKEIVFMNTHIDYREDDAERVLNVQQLREVTEKHSPNPLIACGDFNDLPGSRMHASMKEDFVDAWEAVERDGGETYPARKPTKRIDYVFVSKPRSGAAGSSHLSLRVISATVIPTEASDHRPLLVVLELTAE